MKFSIAIPSLNQGEYIERTLRSVLAEAERVSLEVIVQDGNSTDQSHHVLLKYKDHPSLSVNIEPDSGQSDAINRALARSTGDIFGWLNSDDVLLPGALEKVQKLFEEVPETELVYGDAVFIDERDEIVSPYPTGDFCVEVMRHRCSVSQPSVFFRASVFEEVGGLDERLNYCMDYDLWMALLTRGVRARRINEVLSATRLHDQTKTHTGGLHFIQEILSMQQARLPEPSTVWRLYETARREPISKIKSKTTRFLIAALLTSLQRPKFVIEALNSGIERIGAHNQSKKIVSKSLRI
ncbi:MAG: glycosyltransferase [Pseudomonadales bacterium]|nr:glycosyltransferase [Pseudomonadales bacterium]